MVRNYEKDYGVSKERAKELRERDRKHQLEIAEKLAEARKLMEDHLNKNKRIK